MHEFKIIGIDETLVADEPIETMPCGFYKNTKVT